MGPCGQASRHCGDCDETVVKVASLGELMTESAKGKCVAVNSERIICQSSEMIDYPVPVRGVIINKPKGDFSD